MNDIEAMGSVDISLKSDNENAMDEADVLLLVCGGGGGSSGDCSWNDQAHQQSDERIVLVDEQHLPSGRDRER